MAGHAESIDERAHVRQGNFCDVEAGLRFAAEAQQFQAKTIAIAFGIAPQIAAALESAQDVARGAFGNAEAAADFGIGEAFAALRGGFENIQRALDGCCWAGFDFCWCSVVLHRQFPVWPGFIDPSIE